jgi:glycosyltransferase involved in cell wall biosynthesis
MNQSADCPEIRERLRVAVVTETYPPEINGVARTVGVMVDALLERGHEIQLVRPRQRSEPGSQTHPSLSLRLVAGMPIPLYPDLRFGLASRRSLQKTWSEWRPDLVHVVTEGPLGWFGVAAAKRLGIPVSSDFHTNFHSYSRHYGFGLFAGAVAGYLRALHNRADCTLVPTVEMKAGLEALDFKRVSVVGRGVDTRLFNPGRRSQALRAAWGCREGEIVVLHVGRIAPEKNLGLFVEAAEAMRRAGDVRVVLVGDGPQGAALRAQHPEFVFCGMRSGEDLASHYASADVFLFPSVTETFGNVTLEAMASGLAVVAYDYAAARQHARHWVSGLLAPLGEPSEFVKMAALLARSRVLRMRIAQEARRAAEEITWEKTFEELESVLSRTTGAGGGQTGAALAGSVHVET